MVNETQQRRFDIVGSLPLELTIQVIRYLDCTDIIRSQRVSKQWHALLSSEAILKQSLREKLTSLGLDLKGTNVPIDNANRYFQWHHRIQYGRPIKKIFLPWTAESTLSPVTARGITYHSRRLCYFIRSDQDIYILNLETGERSTYSRGYGNIWTMIKGTALSDRYLVEVAAQPLGQLYSTVATVWDMQTSQRLINRLPDYPRLSSFVKDKVVISCGHGGVDCSVYIWDLTSNLIQKVEGRFSDPSMLHIAPDEDVLVVFEVNWKMATPLVWQSKWSLTTGKLLEEKQFCLPLEGRFHISPHKRTIFRALFFDSTFSYRTVSWHALARSNGKQADLHLIYDYTADELRARWIECAGLHREPYNFNRPAILTPNFTYYFALNIKQPAVYNVPSSTTTLLPDKLDTRVVAGSESLQGRFAPFFHSFGDQEVFGLAGEGGVQLWFFNPNFVPDLLDGKLLRLGNNH
ncbi:hypothetical protein VTN49DRAFT_87 [Thermomyces lanuginosus]|uniref:uncharacterized protein n=1 Tax=Thermomyces lanuginosus TaxID=5541 RepID=UPI00374411B6